MGWLTTLPAPISISKRNIVETVYQYANAGANRRYSSRQITTTVVEYRSMTEAAANTSASTMSSDSIDGNGKRTVVTVEISRQNDAGAYKITKTTQETTAWSAWSAWNPPLVDP